MEITTGEGWAGLDQIVDIGVTSEGTSVRMTATKWGESMMALHIFGMGNCIWLNSDGISKMKKILNFPEVDMVAKK